MRARDSAVRVVAARSDAGRAVGRGARKHTASNLHERPVLVLNFPALKLWASVERLALLTGANPVPPGKPAACRYEPDKFGAAGLTPHLSHLVRPPRVAECPAQVEAPVSDIRAGRFSVKARRAEY